MNYCNCPDCRNRNCPAGEREVELERDNAALRADKERLEKEAFIANAKSTLQASCDPSDKERLDWLEDNVHALHYGLECKVCVRGEDGMEFNGETWRAAIDVARAALAQGGEK